MILDIVNEKFKGKKRLNHILGVAKLAKNLAKKNNVDPEKAYIAGLLHDFCKYDSIEDMKSLMSKEDIEKFKDVTEIYHAYASSEYAKKYLGIDDEEILNAIKFHVFGRINMTKLEKIIVVSDFAEETRDFKEADIVRTHLDDLDKALYETLKYSVEFIYNKGKTPLKEELEVLNYYKEINDGIIKRNI